MDSTKQSDEGFQLKKIQKTQWKAILLMSFKDLTALKQ